MVTPHGITLAVRCLTEDVRFRRNAAAEYAKMGVGDMEKAFEKGRAATAIRDADAVEQVITLLMSHKEESKS